MLMKKLCLAILAGCLLTVFIGCDSVTRHKVLTAIFDGVPLPPPPEQVCEDYAQQKLASLRSGATETAGEETRPQSGSSHPPYAEKDCNGCHDRSQPSGFVSARLEDLCFVCHKGFIKGTHVHGPVAASDCLFCHDPHTSRHSSLLKADKSEICATCHREQRVAAGMHENVMGRNMACVDCHDPHYGKTSYFLK